MSIDYLAIGSPPGVPSVSWVPDIRNQDLIPQARHLTTRWMSRIICSKYVSWFPSITEWLGHLLPLELSSIMKSVHLDMGQNAELLNPFYVGMALSVILPPHVKVLLAVEDVSPTAQYRAWAKHVSEARLHGIQPAYSKQEPGYRLVTDHIASPGQAASSPAGAAVSKADKIWNTLTESGEYQYLDSGGVDPTWVSPASGVAEGRGGGGEGVEGV